MRVYRIYPKTKLIPRGIPVTHGLKDPWLSASIQEGRKYAWLKIDIIGKPYENLLKVDDESITALKDELKQDLRDLAFRILKNKEIWKDDPESRVWAECSLIHTPTNVVYNYESSNHILHVGWYWLSIHAEKEPLWKYAKDVRKFGKKWKMIFNDYHLFERVGEAVADA